MITTSTPECGFRAPLRRFRWWTVLLTAVSILLSLLTAGAGSAAQAAEAPTQRAFIPASGQSGSTQINYQKTVVLMDDATAGAAVAMGCLDPACQQHQVLFRDHSRQLHSLQTGQILVSRGTVLSLGRPLAGRIYQISRTPPGMILLSVRPAALSDIIAPSNLNMRVPVSSAAVVAANRAVPGQRLTAAPADGCVLCATTPPLYISYDDVKSSSMPVYFRFQAYLTFGLSVKTGTLSNGNYGVNVAVDITLLHMNTKIYYSPGVLKPLAPIPLGPPLILPAIPIGPYLADIPQVQLYLNADGRIIVGGLADITFDADLHLGVGRDLFGNTVPDVGFTHNAVDLNVGDYVSTIRNEAQLNIRAIVVLTASFKNLIDEVAGPAINFSVYALAYQDLVGFVQWDPQKHLTIYLGAELSGSLDLGFADVAVNLSEFGPGVPIPLSLGTYCQAFPAPPAGGAPDCLGTWRSHALNQLPGPPHTTPAPIPIPTPTPTPTPADVFVGLHDTLGPGGPQAARTGGAGVWHDTTCSAGGWHGYRTAGAPGAFITQADQAEAWASGVSSTTGIQWWTAGTSILAPNTNYAVYADIDTCNAGTGTAWYTIAGNDGVASFSSGDTGQRNIAVNQGSTNGYVYLGTVNSGSHGITAALVNGGTSGQVGAADIELVPAGGGPPPTTTPPPTSPGPTATSCNTYPGTAGQVAFDCLPALPYGAWTAAWYQIGHGEPAERYWWTTDMSDTTTAEARWDLTGLIPGRGYQLSVVLPNRQVSGPAHYYLTDATHPYTQVGRQQSPDAVLNLGHWTADSAGRITVKLHNDSAAGGAPISAMDLLADPDAPPPDPTPTPPHCNPRVRPCPS